MDPFSALAAAGNVLQFIEVGVQIGSKAVHYIKKGGSLEQQRLQDVLQQLMASTEQLRQQLESDMPKVTSPGSKRAVYVANKQCLELSTRFFSFLDDIKLTTSKNPLRVVRAALRSQRAEKKMAHFQVQLDQAKAQLTLALMVYMSSERPTLSTAVQQNGAINDKLLDQNNTLLAQLQLSGEMKNDIRQLTTDFAKFAIDQTTFDANLQSIGRRHDETMKDFSSRLDGVWASLSKDLVSIKDSFRQLQFYLDREEVACHKVTNSLFFPEMDERRSNISNTHGQTFRWILQQHQRNDDLWDNYVKWLNQENQMNLYWVRGKPGSGKSTLMRYLSENVGNYLSHNVRFQDNQLKSSWLDGNDTVLATYYFWYAGSVVHRSNLGLLQSLLCQVYEARPWLIRTTIVSRRWEDAMLSGVEQRPWTRSELVTTLDKVFAETDTECKFLFIVDGLDEFQGSEEEREEMGQLFYAWCTKSHVKMTVSSRPWVVYKDLFTSAPQLKLEELTRHDIHDFVYDLLYGDSIFANEFEADLESSKTLVAERIVERADGVFLWVRLVVRSMIQLSRDGATLEELVEELENIPDDLDEFFMRMMNGIKPRYQREASVLLQVALAEFDITRDEEIMQAPSFLVSDLQYLDPKEDAWFCLRPTFKAVTHASILIRYKRFERRLASRCLGLLEIAEGFPSGSLWRHKIVFLHRTVKDFLRRPEIQDVLVNFSQGQSYDGHAFRCNSLLANTLTAQIESPFYVPLSEGTVFCRQIMTRPQDDTRAFDLFDKFIKGIRRTDSHARSAKPHGTTTKFASILYGAKGKSLDPSSVAVQLGWQAYVDSRLTKAALSMIVLDIRGKRSSIGAI